jgi:hypothetical protein
MRRHPPHHLSPARAIHPAGQDPEAHLSRPSHHSNAPIKPEGQSILSKIVALTPSKGSFGKSFSASTALGTVFQSTIFRGILPACRARAEGEGEIAPVRFVSLSPPNKRSLCPPPAHSPEVNGQ